MLRIFFWKLGFEWVNLLRLLWPRHTERIYYFAFGANLSPEVLKQRRIAVFETLDFALQDCALRFTQSGFYQDHGFASAEPALGERVYGKLYLIRQSDARRMDYYEGVPWLRAHHKVMTRQQGYYFYYYRATQVVENLKPTQEYLDYITQAYRKMDMVPIDYIQAMEALPVLRVFKPLNRTGNFVRNLADWPPILHPLLIQYEASCRRLVKWTWNMSLLTGLIKA
ncbi:gamma-glutamylcyclotransferase family protein [Thiolinea disciformis]|uniref:gamma-glutamylcyclotransferase family protein n=1 Tax=Thiolinea disciformis TaxID=125614 RepID=UPI00036A600B|nr:gamma-glutamylcyclotransferase family protein [Thiolinea disciformis]